MRRSISLSTVIFFICVMIAVLFFIGHKYIFTSSHVQAAVEESRIHYLSVPIVAEDTLSEIASEYYSDEFGSMDDYIARIKQYNSLTSDAIYAGNYLIVPIYESPSDDIS